MRFEYLFRFRRVNTKAGMLYVSCAFFSIFQGIDISLSLRSEPGRFVGRDFWIVRTQFQQQQCVSTLFVFCFTVGDLVQISEAGDSQIYGLFSRSKLFAGS